MSSGEFHKIAILNSKGGSGKTTLAVSLAAALAARGLRPSLVDCDSQGYSMRWLDKRAKRLPKIYGLAAHGDGAARPLRERVQPDSRVVILDLPAAIPHEDLHDFTYFSDSVLIPVMPSEIDTFSASRLIAELLLDAQLDRRLGKLAIVANRVRSKTRSFRKLQQFLASLQIPLIASFRDSQNFVHAAAYGLGISELSPYLVRNELEQLESIMNWLGRRGVQLERSDMLPGDSREARLSSLEGVETV